MERQGSILTLKSTQDMYLYVQVLVQVQIYTAGPMATFSPHPHFQTPSGGAKLDIELTINLT